MSEAALLVALKKVVDAWTVEGAMPPYHRQMQDRLRIEWPTLALALDRAERARKEIQ